MIVFCPSCGASIEVPTEVERLDLGYRMIVVELANQRIPHQCDTAAHHQPAETRIATLEEAHGHLKHRVFNLEGIVSKFMTTHRKDSHD